MGSGTLQMFVPRYSLAHQERKLFAPRKFMKIITPRLFCGTPQSLVSSGLIKQISFNDLKKSNLARFNKENVFRLLWIRSKITKRELIITK